MDEIGFIDSHTEGEPTRVIVEGLPDVAGTARERREALRAGHDDFRRAVVLEPRGAGPLVAALLYPPRAPQAAAQVIFVNNVGYLGMCVHGAIGVARTLSWMGRAAPGEHVLETPVGDVVIRVGGPDEEVAVRNVPSRRTRKDVAVATERHGVVRGDVAWGGNWFFLADVAHDLFRADDRAGLMALVRDLRTVLDREGPRGDDGTPIDHVALFGPPRRPDAHARNFVLCPGGEYDRSPCGTGTSAWLACLAADGRLQEGETWRQEGICGGVFGGRYARAGDAIVPTIVGRAHLTAQGRLLFERDDPLRRGTA